MALKQKYTPRKIGTIVDSIHIVIGIAVTIMAIFAIFKPLKYMFLFPVIFFMAAVLSGVTGWYMLTTVQRNSKMKATGVVYLILTALLLLLFVISAVSIWGHS